MKNLEENQILKNEELSQVLGGTADTNILSEKDEINDFDRVDISCPGSTCRLGCKALCSAGCQSGCAVASSLSGPIMSS